MSAIEDFKDCLKQILCKIADIQSNSKAVDNYVYHCLLFSSNLAPIPNYPKWSDYLKYKCDNSRQVGVCFYTSPCHNLNLVECLEVQCQEAIKFLLVFGVGFTETTCDRSFEVLKFIVIPGIQAFPLDKLPQPFN